MSDCSSDVCSSDLLAVRYGDMVYVSGLPPFEEDFCARLREARSKGEPLPKYERRPIEVETRIVMNHMQWLLQAAGTTMDNLLKVTVWLRDQKEQAAFDPIYRSYFGSTEALPARPRIQAGATPFDCGLEKIGRAPCRAGRCQYV